MNNILEIQVFIAKKIWFLPFLIGGFVEKDRALLYMPRFGKKVKEWFLSKSVFDDPIKI